MSATAAGASTSLSTPALGGGYGAPFGGDLVADPFSTYSSPVTASCTGTADNYDVTFPATDAFPGGYPIPISMVYFVNVVGSGRASQIVSSKGAVQLFAPNGSQVASGLLTAATVTSLSFGAASVVPTPNPTSPVQLSAAAQTSYPRFVKLLAAPGSCLFFRE